jgi:hypothetical protein
MLTCKLLPQGPSKGSAHHLHTHHNDLGQVLSLWAEQAPGHQGASPEPADVGPWRWLLSDRLLGN